MSPTPPTPSEAEKLGTFQAPIFGAEAQALIACNQKLQELGIDDTIKLPRIVVCGDQSTGKSSLIEAISTIVVPKASGLCTKCPIAINLNNDPSTKWKCTVFIEEKFAYDARKKQKVTKANPLGPWHQQAEMRVTAIKTTEDPAELCTLIDMAQKMILNPNLTRDKQTDFSTTGEDQERFSPNIIRLDIAAAGWANLSFVDLPGVIARAGKGQPDYYVEVVESLARQYARDENNIILLTLPLNHDNDNSRSYGLIESERILERTIAVFTKIDVATMEQRLACLNHYFDDESEEEFGHGQHMVMLGPSSEDDFFAESPWKDLPPNTQTRLGVENLRTRIREILLTQIRNTLPQNLMKIGSRLEKVAQLLKELPAPPDARSLPWKLREQLLKFEYSAKQLFGHGSSSRTCLKTAMGNFSSQMATGKPVIKYLSKQEAEELEDAQCELREASVAEVAKADDDDDDESDETEDSGAHHFSLEDITRLNRQYNTSNVPGEIEPRAVEVMSKLSVESWDDKLTTFVTELTDLMLKQVQICVDENFGHQKHLPLYPNINTLAKQYLSIAAHEETLAYQRHCTAEKSAPFTLDHASLTRHERLILKSSRESRRQTRITVAQARHKASHIGMKGKQRPYDESSLAEDDRDLDIRMAAKASAYYEVASKRFVDVICQDTLTVLVPRIHNEMVPHITRKLGLSTDETIQQNQVTITELMSEHPEREAQRRRLYKEAENLRAGQDYIVEVLGATGFQRQGSGDGTRAASASDEMMLDGVLEAAMPNATPPTDASPRKRKAGVDQEVEGADEDGAKVQTEEGGAHDESPTKKARTTRCSTASPSPMRSVENIPLRTERARINMLEK